MARSHCGVTSHIGKGQNRSQNLSSPRLRKLSTPKNKPTTPRNNRSPKQSSPNPQMYLSDPVNGSNQGEDTTNRDKHSAGGYANTSDKETELEFSFTSRRTQYDKQTQPTLNHTSPNSGDKDINNTTPHGNEDDTDMRSEGTNTSPSSNATVNKEP
eukprot:8470432-Ditylum_brightwellii.AAC.1